MVTRRGTAATITASLIFSSLVISNLVVFYSAMDRARLASAASEEHRLSGGFEVGAGVGAIELLASAQRTLESRQWRCSSLQTDITASLAGRRILLEVAGVGIEATVGSASALPAGDNLSMAAPFDGGLPGRLNLGLAISGNEDGPVSFEKTELHVVHLPVRATMLSSVCAQTVSEVEAAIASAGPCGSADLSGAMSSAITPLQHHAASNGVILSVSVLPVVGCTVSFDVSAQERGLAGPLGDFTFAAAEEGSSPLPTG